MPKIDPAFAFRSPAIPITIDGELIREKYRPFLLDPAVESSDWVSRLELATAPKMARYDIERTGEQL
jgi:arsenic resistance protein ArsH